MRRPSLKILKFPNEATAKARGGGSREAIVGAAQRLFLERGFGAVSMDDLAPAAGVARRTLYNQFASKEEIFREMLLRVSGQFDTMAYRHCPAPFARTLRWREQDSNPRSRGHGT